MLRTILFCLALALPAQTAAAQDGAKPAITGVIQSQIDAFLRDDFETAFTFASPNIKRLFGTPQRFGMMVMQGYPMVWRPDDVRYLELDERGGRTLQKVMITDPGGAIHMLEYEMLATEDGWQINGVRLLPRPELGA
jgi:hypothetical protein